MTKNQLGEEQDFVEQEALDYACNLDRFGNTYWRAVDWPSCLVPWGTVDAPCSSDLDVDP